jgi:hypothetical protein
MGYGWKLCEKKKMMLNEKMSKVVKGEKKTKFRKYISKAFHTPVSYSSISDICLFLHH